MEIKTIKATARISTKVGDDFFTFEYGEERTVDPKEDIEVQRNNLFDDCFNTVADQIQSIQ